MCVCVCAQIPLLFSKKKLKTKNTLFTVHAIIELSSFHWIFGFRGKCKKTPEKAGNAKDEDGDDGGGGDDDDADKDDEEDNFHFGRSCSPPP